MTRRRVSPRTLVIASGVVLAALAGCVGQGKYTAEGASLAEKRMSALKAATEYSMAEQAFLAGDLDKAERTIDRAIGLSADVAINYVLAGRIRLEQGRIGESLAFFGRAIEINDGLAEAHYYLGVVSERLRRTSDAVNHFMAAAESEPLDPQFTVAAGEMLVDLDRLDEAEEFLMGSAVFDHAPAVKQLLGHISMIRGLHEEASERFEEAALLSPSDDAIREDLVAALVAAGRYAEAEREITKLMAVDVASGGESTGGPAPRRDLMHLRGLCLIALGRPIEARRIYKDLTDGATGATDLDAWVGLGRASFLVGDTRSLKQAGERAKAIAPEQSEGPVLLALYSRAIGDSEAALQAIDAFDGEQTPDVRTLRALILADLGRYDESREQLFIALEHSPDDRSAMNLLDRLPERELDSFANAPTE
ncbi:MAG: tetratricopeptide repeat protein [Planctomycetota bacterium]